MEKRRILLVEDDPDHRQIIRRSFYSGNSHEFRLTDVASLADARREMEEHSYDLVIVDWKLRDGSGTELLPGYCEEAALPFVMLTGYENSDAITDAMRKGAVDFIVKSPDTLQHVPQYVERALREWDIRHLERVHRHRLSSTHKLAELGYYAGHVLTHGMNNILGSLLNYGEEVEADISDGRITRTTEENVRKMLTLAEDAAKIVRSLRRVTAEGDRQNRVVFGIEEVVRERLELLQPLVPQGMQVSFDNPDGKERYCEGDVDQFRAMVMNLVTNAREAIPSQRRSKGRIEIVLDELKLDEPFEKNGMEIPSGSYHHLRVEDNGKGINKNHMEHLFEAFHGTHQDGTGLGLATAKHYVTKLLEGYIWAESEWNKGTTFHVAIPATKVRPGESTPELEMGYSGSGQQLLLVDDESEFLQSMKQKLIRLKYKVKDFSNPRAALDHYELYWRDFAAVLTDEIMPQMTGSAMFREMRRINPSVRGVVITGYGGEKMDASKAKKIGFFKMLHKPVRRHEIGAVLMELLKPARKK